MSAEAKQMAIRWRRLLFGFHLLMVLIVRLSVGSISEMPPAEIYNGFAVWGFLMLIHALLLAVLDGRDRADLPFDWMERIIRPRERRWSLFAIDMVLYVLFTIAIANRVIPERFIFENPVTFALLWLAHTALVTLHILLMIYAEVYDRSQNKGKRKNDAFSEAPMRLVQADDGELIEWDDIPEQKLKRSGGK